MKRQILKLFSIIAACLWLQTSDAKGLPSGAESDPFYSSGTYSQPEFSEDHSDCTKSDKCFSFSFKSKAVSKDGKYVTLTFLLKNTCKKSLSYVAFELPKGATAYAAGKCQYSYKASIINSPFRAIRFEAKWNKHYYKDNEEEFQYVMTKAVYDKLTTIRVIAKSGNTTGSVTFDKDCDVPKCLVSPLALKNVKYIVDGKTYIPTPETLVTLLQEIVQQNKPVSICFTVQPSEGYKSYSLVSYKAPYSVFVRSAAHLQELYDYQTVTVGPEGGDYCLKINVPNCYFQVDFARGCIIQKLGPADTNPDNFYGTQGRLISHAEGGTTACKPEEKLGKEGCTPGYWKQEHHFGNWAPAVPTGSNATKFFDVFTVCDQCTNSCKYQGLSPNLTLLEALNLNGGGFNALARHAAAAYLNAVNPNVDYGISANDVIKAVVFAFKTGYSELIKNKLEYLNEKGCPLGRSVITYGNKSQAAAEEPVTEESSVLGAHPNPLTDRTTVTFSLKKAERYTVNLYDMQGRQIRHLRTGNAKAGERLQVIVERNGLTEGMYFVRLMTREETKTIKLSVLRR